MKKEIKHILFLFGIVLFVNPIFAQNHAIDSIKQVLNTGKEDTNEVNTLNKLSSQLWQVNKYDTSLIYANKAVEYAEKLNYKKGLAEALSNIADIYREQGNNLKSLDYSFKSLAINQEINNKKDIAQDYKAMGLCYMEQGDYSKGVGYFFKSLAIDQEIGNKDGVGSNLCNIGNVYLDQGNYPEALEYFSKSMAIEQEIGNQQGIAINLSNIGDVNFREGKYSEVLKYDFKSLEIEEKIGNKYGVAHSLSNIGGFYFSEADYSNALEYNFKALALYKEIQHQQDIAPILLSIGDIYTYQKNLKKAATYYDSALLISMNNGYKETIRDIYDRIAKLDGTKGNYKAELEDYKKFVLYSDSLVNEDNTKKALLAAMTYEFAQKQMAGKAEQDKKDALAKQESKRQKVIRDSFMGGFILMLALAFFIYLGYRQKQKANVTITHQKELVEKQKEEVERQKNIIEHHKELVEEKNKDITDSINYARRIQRALLKEEKHVSKHLPEHFILFKPKDIVSGDFYWAVEKEEYFYFAAADCTGHGVPGGFMSMLGLAFLNEITKGSAILTPAEILDELRNKILTEFKHKEGEDQSKDGMDISLMRMNLKTSEIQWSGANNPLYVIDGVMKETPADKQPIGYFPLMKPFTNHFVKTEKGSVLYLFSDGYADQFGGPKGKKFKQSQFKELLLSIHKKGMNEQKDILDKALKDWMGKLEQVDDILIIGIRV